MAKQKSKYVMIYIKSLVSGHKATFIKPRMALDKIEVYRWDPYIQQMSVYKESEKIKGMKY